VRIVSVAGLKSQFKIPPEDVITADNMPFIRMRSNSWTLMGVIFEKNPDAPVTGKSLKGVSLTCCIGLNKLMQIRNEAQAKYLAPQGGSTLFQDDENDQKTKKNKPVMSRLEMKTKRDEHVMISIDIQMDGTTHSIQVLRPVHPKDALHVLYDDMTLGIVLKYMRESGFTEKKPQFKHQGAPGILKRHQGFVVVTKDADDQKHFKSTPSLNDAMQVQSGTHDNSSNDAEDEKVHNEPCVEADMGAEVDDGDELDASGDDQPED